MTGQVARPRVVLTDDRFGESEIERTLLEAGGMELVVADCASSADVILACREADGILVNLAPLDGAALESLESCRAISRYGVGMDNIDLETAARLGIAVRNVPGYCDLEVAEHALGLILALARGIASRDRSVREGAWGKVPPGRRLSGSRLGILGFGGTARALVRKALSLGFAEILVWSPHISQARLDAELGAAPEALGVTLRPAGFDELLAASDWISVHLPLKPETRGILGARALGLLQPGSFLVNVSRGAVVEEAALIEALRSGRLGGAGLDVYSAEPLPRYSVLRGLPNLVLTDHAAYASRESIAELRRRCVVNLIEELAK